MWVYHQLNPGPRNGSTAFSGHVSGGSSGRGNGNGGGGSKNCDLLYVNLLLGIGLQGSFRPGFYV